jgi:hypothetical protein
MTKKLAAKQNNKRQSLKMRDPERSCAILRHPARSGAGNEMRALKGAVFFPFKGGSGEEKKGLKKTRALKKQGDEKKHSKAAESGRNDDIGHRQGRMDFSLQDENADKALSGARPLAKVQRPGTKANQRRPQGRPFMPRLNRRRPEAGLEAS